MCKIAFMRDFQDWSCFKMGVIHLVTMVLLRLAISLSMRVIYNK